MSAPQLERAELLFRRQVALEGNAPHRLCVRRIDGVPALMPPPARQAALADTPERGGILPEMPGEALLASPGYFNISRIDRDAVAWTILIGRQSLATLEQTLLKLCNAQSAKKSFRPIFIVGVPEHIELMRRYGFTFEVLSDPDFVRMSKEEQIGFYMAKWNSPHRVDLTDDNSATYITVQEVTVSTGSTYSDPGYSTEPAAETNMKRAL